MQQTQTRPRMPKLLIAIAALIALALPVGVLAAGNLTGSGSAGSPATSAGPRLADVTLYAAPNGSTPRKTFSASADNELYVQLHWLNLDAGLHDAYVTLTSPDHTVYQVLDLPFRAITPNSNAPAAPERIQRPGVLHPVTVQAVAPAANGGGLLTGQVPIAGTWMGRLTGAWQISVKLDANPAVFGPFPFVLSQ